MKRLMIFVLACVMALPAFSWAGWRDVLEGAERVDKLIGNRPAPAPAREAAEPADEVPPPAEAPRSAPRSGDDAHYIQPDDYFIGKEELGGHTYIYVSLSKMLAAPTANTKDEGEFMKVKDGQNVWTSYIWQSRIAAKSELRLGQHIIIFEDNSQRGVYQAPAKKDSARKGRWFYAKITDVSDMYKGFVTVSGGYKVGLNNARIPIRFGAQ